MLFKKKCVQTYMSLLILMVFSSVGYSSGLNQSNTGFYESGQYDFERGKLGFNEAGLQTNPWQPNSDIFSTDDSDGSLLFAKAGGQGAGGQEPLSPECQEFANDPDADVGEILRAGCQPTLAQMSALMDNPLGNVAMLFTQFDFTIMKNQANDRTANKVNYMGLAQFPKGLGKRWNLINRIVWNVPSMPIDQDKIDDAIDFASRQYGSGPGPSVLPPAGLDIAPIDLFEGRTTGFGDMYYVGLFAPKKGYKTKSGANLLWGIGPALGFPTATKDVLGTGKWLAGPAGLGVYMGPKWKIGALLQQYFSYAGDSDRDDVSLMNLQYFIFYSIDDVTSIGVSPNIIANWKASSGNKWTVPIGLGISRTFQFGKVPVRFGLEAHYSVVQPDDVAGSEWNFRFYVIPAVPSALFKWMQ
jgi:hypothetical protein